MAVHKFKTFIEAEKALWNFRPDARYYQQVKQFFQLAACFGKFSVKRGIQKYRSLQDLQAGENRDVFRPDESATD